MMESPSTVLWSLCLLWGAGYGEWFVQQLSWFLVFGNWKDRDPLRRAVPIERATLVAQPIEPFFFFFSIARQVASAGLHTGLSR